jgi:hypothetical protein
MRNLRFASLTGLLCVAALAQPVTPPKYVQIDYMKVDAGRGQQYVKMEQEIFKPIHQDRIKKGTIESWAVYAVRFPAGTNREYDFMTATTFPNYASMELPYKGTDIAQIHPNMTAQEIGERASSARKLIRSDVFYTIDRVGIPSKWKYMEMQFMKAEPGNGGDYLRVVQELWKPVHEERVKEGLILGWGIAGLRYPGGSNREYDYVTATYYDTFAGLEEPYKGIDEAKLNAAGERAATTRKLVRGEVWILVDRVSKQ